MTDTTTPRPTTAPDKASLLTALDRLPHGARLAHVARLGRDGVDRPGLAALVDALLAVDGDDGGDTYEGLLGVTLAQALGDLERVARARSHPSIVVAARAIGHLLRMPESDAALRVAVLDAPPAFRPRLLAGIVRTKRASLAAALFPLLVARGDGASAGRLLPLLSPEARRAALPAHAWQARGWPLLVRAEPALCAAILADELTRAGADVARVWRQRAGLVGWLAELAPAELFPLLERWLDGVSVAALAPLAKPLLRHDANRLIALAAEPGLRALMTSIVAAGRGLRRLDDDQLARLGRLATSPAELVPLFEAIGWRRRATLFEALWPEAARAGRDDFPVSLLALLPAPLRHREAARLLAIPALAAAADTARALLALSPLGLAEPELRRLARSSDANVRGAHMAALVTAATRERTPDEVLAFLAERIRNDQDPVRQLVFIALADARPSAWTEASAPLLAGMVADACRARDTSHATRLAMQRLAQRLLRNFAGRGRDARVDAAMQMLVELAAETHGLALPKLEKEISQAVASELFAALEATASASTQLEKGGIAVALAQSLGRRAFGIERLQALLERLALDGNHGVAAQAIPVWMADPARREARVERLLAKDPSAGTLHAVFAHLDRRRQDRLDPYLTGLQVPGRFRLGKVIPLPPVMSRCFRWLPRQQHAYAAMLATVAASTGQSHVSRAYVVGQLAHLPAVGADAFERYLRSTDVPTCEAALAALSRTDRPAAALPRLLDFLDGDRARVAMYAVPRVARFLAPSALEASLAPLARASERKVTVRKEALRLLGMHRTPGALAVLDALAADATTHPDVVAAVVHAARSLADRAEARALLGRLAASPHASVAQALLAGSIDSLAPEARGEYARIVLALLEHDDPRTRRLAVNTLLPFTAGVEPQAVAALSRVIQRLDRLESWADAVRVTVALATRQDLADGVADALHELVVGLVAASDAEHAAGAAWPTDARDLPATQRLSQLVGALAAADLRRRRAVVRLYDRLAAALASPGWHPARAALALAAVDLHHPDRAAPRLAALADDPSLAPYAETLSRILEGVREVEIDAVALVDALAARGSLGARLALALVRAVGGRHAWPEPAVAALSRLRQSPDEPTAYAARRTFVRREVPAA